MMLSPHFSLEEFTRSSTAVRAGICNDLPMELLANARATAAMLERIREFLRITCVGVVPMSISSGYRCLALNTRLGSKPSSDHVQALAADWEAPVAGDPTDICRLLEPHLDALGIGQLINEFPGPGGWVHTSAAPCEPRNRVITITHAGTAQGITGETE